MDGFILGDLISLSIVFFLYLGAASGRKKKGRKGTKAREHRSPMRTRAQGEQSDTRSQVRDQKAHEGFAEAFDHAEQTACKDQPMHLHEVSQQQFLNAAEGEDPCHAGGVSRKDEFFDVQNTEHDTLAQDVLRGVIMSEILMRPHERAALRRGRR